MTAKTTVTVLLGVLFASACATKGDDGGENGALDAAASADGGRDTSTAQQDTGTLPDTSGANPGDAQAADTGPGTCGPIVLFSTLSLPDCDTCLTNQCCALTKACLDLADCKALSECAIQCPAATDPKACSNTCSAMHPASIAKGNLWIKCMQAKCTGICTP